MAREERRSVEEAVLALAQPLAEAMGLSVLDVQYARRGGRTVLEVCVDRKGPAGRAGEAGGEAGEDAEAVAAGPAPAGRVRSGRAGVTLAECESFSRRLSVILDVEDPVRERYVLEVASPGLDRVLRRELEFDHFRGRRVRVRARGALQRVTPDAPAAAGARPSEGHGERREVEGRLLGLASGKVRVRDDEGQVWEAELGDVARAQLVPEFR